MVNSVFASKMHGKGMVKMKTLYFASENRGKTLEMQNLFTGIAQVRDLNELSIPVTWEETGATFRDNALIKVRAVSAILKGDVFADDSGLCVDALNGEPGVCSARWAGPNCDDEANNRKLLKALSSVPESSRRASFVCSIVYKNEKNEEFFFDGQMMGHIAKEVRGSGGFGYDSLFIPDGYDRTLAELPLDEKNKISHRFQAVRKLRDFLASFR